MKIDLTDISLSEDDIEEIISACSNMDAFSEHFEQPTLFVSTPGLRSASKSGLSLGVGFKDNDLKWFDMNDAFDSCIESFEMDSDNPAQMAYEKPGLLLAIKTTETFLAKLKKLKKHTK